MVLEDYFDFQAPDDIRIRGTRVGIEHVLYDFLYRDRSPQEMARSFPTLTLEQIYATLTYYYRNQAQVDAYLKDWLDWSEEQRRLADENPSPVALRLRALRAELEQRRKA